MWQGMMEVHVTHLTAAVVPAGDVVHIQPFLVSVDAAPRPLMSEVYRRREVVLKVRALAELHGVPMAPGLEKQLRRIG